MCGSFALFQPCQSQISARYAATGSSTSPIPGHGVFGDRQSVEVTHEPRVERLLLAAHLNRQACAIDPQFQRD